MNKISEALERNFQSIVTKKSDFEVISGIVQYVKFVFEASEMESVLRKLKEMEIADTEQFEKAIDKDDNENTTKSHAEALKEQKIFLHKESTSIWSFWQDLVVVAMHGDIFKDFNKEKYVAMCENVHNYFINETERQMSVLPMNKSGKIIFDEQKSILHFMSKEIKIATTKDNDTKPHRLLKTIFKDRNKTWNFDEIANDWRGDNSYEKNEWNSFYQAGYAVNEKIQKETSIKDFLILTKKATYLNKKYIQ